MVLNNTNIVLVFMILITKLICLYFRINTFSINPISLGGSQFDIALDTNLMVGVDCARILSKRLFLNKKRGMEVPTFVTFPNSLYERSENIVKLSLSLNL